MQSVFSIPAESPETSCGYHKLTGVILAPLQIKEIRLISESMKEEMVTFRISHHYNPPAIVFESNHTINEWLSGKTTATIVLQILFCDGSRELRKIQLTPYKYQAIKEAKISKIIPYLVCPVCKKVLKQSFPELACSNCKITYSHNGNAFSFLIDELKKKLLD